MNVQLRMTRHIYNQIRADLSRPHPFAGERVGFLFAKHGLADGDTILVLPANYQVIPDDQYIDDPKVGAKINSIAIRNAMQRSMDNGESVFHVHMHEHLGRPAFSRLDRRELFFLIQSFQNVSPKLPHGAMVLSYDDTAALIWLPNEEKPVSVAKITVVGYPVTFHGEGTYV